MHRFKVKPHPHNTNNTPPIELIKIILLLLKTEQEIEEGFTTVEIMIVVAIIALLAAIAVPNFLRARKRSQAVTIMEELRTIDGAQRTFHYTRRITKADLTVAWSDLMLYFRAGFTPLRPAADAADARLQGYPRQ